MMDSGDAEFFGPPLLFFHGFLGAPSDWDSTLRALVQRFGIPETHLKCIDFTHIPELSSNHSLELWGAQFSKFLLNNYPELLAKKPLLVGYSMGARLALYSYFANPNIWTGLVCISGHPGLAESTSPEGLHARNSRWASDSSWSQRFLLEPWSELMNSWNQQSVFSGDHLPLPKFDRDPGVSERKIYSKCLSNWSLAHQKDFRPQILKNFRRILWVVGEMDAKFSIVAKELKQENDNFDVAFIKNCGHRIHLSHPAELAKLLQIFMGKLNDVPSNSR